MGRWLAGVVALCLACPLAAQEFFTLEGHGGPIRQIAVAPDGRIATASFDNSVGLWADGTPHWYEGHAAAVNTVLFAHDALFSGGDDFTLRRWPDGAEVGRHDGKIVALAALPDAIASASWDGTIGLWPLDDTNPSRMTGHQGPVNALVLRGDGALLSASTDGSIRAWDVATGQETARLVRDGFGINALALDPAGKWLAYGAADGTTRVIDPATGAAIADFTADRRPILALAVSPDGSRLAVGDGHGYIMVIDTRAWSVAHDFRATASGPIWTLAFSVDGRHILAGGLENRVYGWPLADLGDQAPMSGAPRDFLRPPETMENGERQFMRKCSICHDLHATGTRRAGPSLAGLFGRRAGTLAGYAYSDILDGSDIVWNDKTIDQLFDIGPDHYIPGSKMPMQRITNPQDRADLIGFLRRATAPE